MEEKSIIEILSAIFKKLNINYAIFAVAVGFFIAWKIKPDNLSYLIVFIISSVYTIAVFSAYVYGICKGAITKKRKEKAEREEKQKREEHANAKKKAIVDRIYDSMNERERIIVSHLVLHGKPNKSEHASFYFIRAQFNERYLWDMINHAESATTFNNGMDSYYSSSLIRHEQQNNHIVVYFDPYLLQLIQQYIKDNKISIDNEQQDE